MVISSIARGFYTFQVISIARDFDLKNFRLSEIVVSFSISFCILIVITNPLVQIQLCVYLLIKTVHALDLYSCITLAETVYE